MNKRKIVWIGISYCIAIASIWMVIKQSKNFKPMMLLTNLQSMHKGWLLLALVCMFGFIWFEGAAIMRIARSLDHTFRKKSGTVYGAADVYFSAMTPSASGGQPASAYFMLKDGMKPSVVTITLLLNLMMYTLALLSIGLVCTAVYGRTLLYVSREFRFLVIAGGVILIGLALLFYLLIYKEQILYRLSNKILSFLEHWRLIQNVDEKRESIHESMLHYKQCAAVISKNKKMLLDAFLLNVLQRISQLAVTFTLFMACGRGFMMSVKATILQTFVAIGSNCVPIPGAMGVADYMILNGFTWLVGSTDAVHMEIICRGITFYGCVITGGILTAIGYIRRRRERC